MKNEKRDSRCKLTLQEELKAIELYQSGLCLSQVAKKLKCSISAIIHTMDHYNVKRRFHGEGTRLLHKHMDVKPPACFSFPLKDKFDKLAAVFLLTDGCLNKGKIQLICTDKILQNYFLYLFKARFNLKPTTNSYMVNGKESSIYSNSVAKELRRLTPTYNTYPKDKTKEKYYKGPQPTLKFLKNENERILYEAIRVAMSCEGSIFPDFQGLTLGAHLQFACSHPELLNQWKTLFSKIGITSFILRSNKTWSGVKGLGIKNMKSIRRFIEIGGFIEGVRITGKSKYYKGIEKNKMLKLLVEMREHSFYFPEGLEIEQKNKMIREILLSPSKKKEYWKKHVEKPEIRLRNRRNEIRKKIFDFIKQQHKAGNFPTTVDIRRVFGVSLLNYFSSKSEAYKEAGIEVEEGRRIICSPRPFVRKKIVKFIRNSARRNYYPTLEDVEKNFNIHYIIYFPSIKDAYQEAGITYPRKIVRHK